MRGLRKHRISGKTTKSPKLRHKMARDANQNDMKRRAEKLTATTVAEALK